MSHLQSITDAQASCCIEAASLGPRAASAPSALGFTHRVLDRKRGGSYEIFLATPHELLPTTVAPVDIKDVGAIVARRMREASAGLFRVAGFAKVRIVHAT